MTLQGSCIPTCWLARKPSCLCLSERHVVAVQICTRPARVWPGCQTTDW